MLRCMRTTLRLDDDVAAILHERKEREGGTLTEIVNRTIRESARRSLNEPRKVSRFRTRAVSLGVCLLPSLDDVAEALAASEDEDFR